MIACFHIPSVTCDNCRPKQQVKVYPVTQPAPKPNTTNSELGEMIFLMLDTIPAYSDDSQQKKRLITDQILALIASKVREARKNEAEIQHQMTIDYRKERGVFQTDSELSLEAAQIDRLNALQSREQDKLEADVEEEK